MTQGEGPGLRYPPLEIAQKLVYLVFLGTKAGDGGKVHVLGEAGFAPALKGQATDETEAEAAATAEILNLQGRGKNRVHCGVRRWKRACHHGDGLRVFRRHGLQRRPREGVLALLA